MWKCPTNSDNFLIQYVIPIVKKGYWDWIFWAFQTMFHQSMLTGEPPLLHCALILFPPSLSLACKYVFPYFWFAFTDKSKFISFALWDHYPTIYHQAVLSKFLLSFGLDWYLALSWWCHLLSGPSHIPSIPASILPPKILLFCFIKD